jgi:hypothetical protein
LKTTEATGAGAGAGEGWRADRKGQAFGRAPAKPVTGPQPVALTTATATPIAMVDKLAHMQAGGAVTQLVSNLVGGRAKGAMPIEITFPTAGTATYEFRMPFAGATQGQIKLTCISTGAALCLQGLIGLVVLCVALVLGWRRADWGALACAAGVILLILARGVSGPAGAEYLRTAYWAAGLALLVLVAKYLVGKVRLRNQLRNQVS